MKTQQQQGFYKSRKKYYTYSIDNLIAIKRIQFLAIPKLCQRFLGPNHIVSEKNEQYKVIKMEKNNGSG